MCTLSDKLKLCTCAEMEIEQLENYWILYRYDKAKDKEHYIIGICEMPLNFFLTKNANENIHLRLLELLNTNTCFDFAYSPKYGDRLAIFLKPDVIIPQEKFADYRKLEYGFEYRKGMWHTCRYDNFGWDRKHNEYMTGEAQYIFE